jgi:hypothetical protein
VKEKKPDADSWFANRLNPRSREFVNFHPTACRSPCPISPLTQPSHHRTPLAPANQPTNHCSHPNLLQVCPAIRGPPQAFHRGTAHPQRRAPHTLSAGYSPP